MSRGHVDVRGTEADEFSHEGIPIAYAVLKRDDIELNLPFKLSLISAFREEEDGAVIQGLLRP